MTNAGVGAVWLAEVASSEVALLPKSEVPSANALRIRERALPGRVLAEPGPYGINRYYSAFALSSAPSSSASSSSAHASPPSSGLPSSYTPALTPEVQNAMLAYCVSQRASPVGDGWRTVLEDGTIQHHELRLSGGPQVKHTSDAYVLSHWTASPELDGKLVKPAGSHVFCVASQTIVSRNIFNNKKRKAAEVDDVEVDSDGHAGASSASSASAPEEAVGVAHFTSMVLEWAKLRDDGILTEDEFVQAKANALSKMGM